VPRQKSDHVDSAAALAERLRAARQRAGLSQRALARGICTPAYVSRLEKGERIPSLQLLRRLAERLDADADELASGMPRAPHDPLLDAELTLRLGDRGDAELAFREALGHPSPSIRGRALAGLAELAFERGEHREAIELFEQARRESPAVAPAVADRLGRAYALAGELESAIAVFEGALALAQAEQDEMGAFRFSVLLSNALIDAGNFGRASELLGSTIASPLASEDPLIRARLWWSQSRLHAKQNDPDTAARYASRAIETLELTEHDTYTARAHQLLAHIELDRGRPEAALELLESGYAMIERTGNRYELAMFDLERARALLMLERREEAASLALSTTGAIGSASPSDAGRGYGLVAQVFAELGENERALELFELADVTLPETSRARREIAANHAELLERLGRKDEALDVLKRAMGVRTDAVVTR
jgi:tetratricopeptide (TPR) repeat protein